MILGPLVFTAAAFVLAMSKGRGEPVAEAGLLPFLGGAALIGFVASGILVLNAHMKNKPKN